MSGRTRAGRGRTTRETGRAVFVARVHTLAAHARRDLVARRASEGLFFGLIPGLLAAALAGTVSLPFSAPAIAGFAAVVGTVSGVVTALLRRIDVRRLLIDADRSLGSRELASTAFELVDAPWGETFSEAVIHDAAALMTRSSPRRMLGALRLPFLPFTPVLVLAIALALIFPFDLRTFFAARHSGLGELAMIGEDLQSYGQRLQDSARSQNLGRSLALAQDLAKLGRDMAEGSIQKDEALDRMADIERRLTAEYDLRLRAFDPGNPRAGGHGQPGAEGRAGTNGSTAGRAGQGDGLDSSRPGDDPGSQDLKDMGDALKRLRQGQGSSPPPGAENSEPPSMAQGPQGPPRQPGSGLLPPGNDSSDKGQGSAPEGYGSGAAPDPSPGQPGKSAPTGSPGLMPAPDTKGPPSRITQGGRGSPLKTDAVPGQGDSTKFLVRALPEWSGSRLPEDKLLRHYAQAAESALTREEVPPKLKEYVKSYFTIIGVSGGDSQH